ncbi:MAG TPA: DUF3563 family protein [Casimicrobiaceae bacterium]|nr:DUF3563 family protein [Casimicrobiaceae bacterium]
MFKSEPWSPKAAELYFKESIIGKFSTVIAEALAGSASAAEVARRAQIGRRAPPADAFVPTATPAAASATPAAASATPPALRMSLLDRLDAWHFRQAQREREAYLARSTDVFDLERRIRAIERGTTGHGY